MIVTGAVIIAGIGFAGSYAAVRELAVKKGFGDFSYVFPIGIDAGICVLLALDLLLTWIRIPFPLLRQTAWLLTAATIAFNGAAAWPDPLGVGMHAVIPILFVVTVEAARHAIGRIADITADKHMEGVRLTRWLLSPVPTFLLWRRMKLWELRSYEQVIKLEQERLVYQARLRSRFGRGWRRKAPVESLMPLRLARYGVPLAETAPAGLAAAGIGEPSARLTVGRTPVPPQRQSPAIEAAVEPRVEPAPQPPLEAHERLEAPEPAGETEIEIETEIEAASEDAQAADDGLMWGDYFYAAWRAYAAEHGAYPDAAALAEYVHRRDGITGAGGRPITAAELHYYVVAFQGREHGDDGSDAAARTTEQTAHSGTQAAREPRGPRIDAKVDERPPAPLPAEDDGLTVADRYYLAWTEYRTRHGDEPSPEELSAFLAQNGVLGRGGNPVSPSTLRRYSLQFRVYAVWADHRAHTEAPSPDAVAQDCADRGITAQYNRAVTPAQITEQTEDFQRRWHLLGR
ncbi:DUF2637 domain-containing protein [Streptomyces sp. A012304]|uniref:DUF2637 domain-containing protein n=2 Tax=Streptomyces sp. A012304 TaxID=375446 RepID=UPI0032929DCF|nr:hypothetical protein ALMP_70650 [Streptomyces sp. A012304]